MGNGRRVIFSAAVVVMSLCRRFIVAEQTVRLHLVSWLKAHSYYAPPAEVCVSTERLDRLKRVQHPGVWKKLCSEFGL